jgi:outer membrane receptor protein involved in Fe transport
MYYTNLNLSYSLKHGDKGQSDLYLNVANLFDRQPAIAGGAPGSFPGNTSPVNADDVLGRYYTAGVRYRM